MQLNNGSPGKQPIVSHAQEPPPYTVTATPAVEIAQPQPQRPLPIRISLEQHERTHSPDLHFIDIDPNDLRSAKRNTYLKVTVVFCVFVLGLWFFWHRNSGTPPGDMVEFTWGALKKGKCMRFNTRLYSAPLLRGNEPVVGTTTKCGFEAWVHGKNVKPVRCELQGARNETWGIWAVDYDEPSCATWWSPPKDTGCTADGSGYRRYEAKLENVEWGASWEDMCKSTPVTFNKRTFNSPNHCINRGILGMYGAWTVEDTECH